MKKALLIGCMSYLLMACGPGSERDIAPTLSAEVTGTYLTNGFLDYLCIALQTGKMPMASLKPETGNVVTLTYLQQYPVAQVQTLTQVQLTRLADNTVQLTRQGQVIGTVRTDRAFNANGMERQAPVLQLQIGDQHTQSTLSFTGAKQ